MMAGPDLALFTHLIIYALNFSPFLAHLRGRETVFNGNAPLHTYCKFLLEWPWLMPLLSLLLL